MTVEREAEQPDNASAISQRRAHLAVEPNPGATRDYLCVHHGGTADRITRLTLRYVPDKLTLCATAFSDYLGAFSDDASLPSLEMLALAVLDDINNEVVPRWVQVVAARGGDGDADHQVIVEDRQPKWENAALLARLRQT